MDIALLLDHIRQFVKKCFTEHHKAGLSFHTYNRTKSVVKAAEKIAVRYELSKKEHFMLLAAAWFHTTGYLIRKEDHQGAASDLATKFLAANDVEPILIDRISSIIMTQPDTEDVEDVLARILHDAIFYYLGTKSFMKKVELQRQEQQWISARKIDTSDWLKETYEWTARYKFQTFYALELLKPRVDKNLKAGIGEQLIINACKSTEAEISGNMEKKEIPEKGIETMIRIASGNNQRLSDMADNKAHILITVNAIILSAVISLILRRLAQQSYLLWPTFILIGVSLFAMVFAILATRPHIFSGRFTQDELKNNETDLLFFGNFFNIKKEEYRLAMLEIMENKEKLYSNLIYNIHGQGMALAKKYRLLRTAYSVFIYGLVIATLTFLVATLW